MAIDPALQEIGVGILDTEDGSVVLSQTFTFTDKEKEQFLAKCYKNGMTTFLKANKDTPKEDRENFIKLWTNERQARFFNFLKECHQKYKIDYLLCENEFHKGIYKINCTVCLFAGLENIPYDEYYPTEWKKMITNKGNVAESSLKYLVFNVINNPVCQYMDENQIDSFGLILAFLKKKNIIVENLRQDIIPEIFKATVKKPEKSKLIKKSNLLNIENGNK